MNPATLPDRWGRHVDIAQVRREREKGFNHMGTRSSRRGPEVININIHYTMNLGRIYHIDPDAEFPYEGYQG